MSDSAGTVVEDYNGPEPDLNRVMGPKLLLLFIVGDILGTGVYALTGAVAGEVGGASWAPFLVAFAVATVTACSYLELVTKYPQAAGAALYTHKAFGVHFVTFLVAFTVMSSGITSASTASYAFASFLNDGFSLDLPTGGGGLMLISIGFMVALALVNFRGVGESVKLNVVLTMVELSGLLLVIFIGLYAITQGNADFDRVVVFESAEGKGTFIAVATATALAFFAMVGFEDSVNMAEECKDPGRDFPKMMLTGLGVTGVIYVLVAITAVALVPVGDLTDTEKGQALTQVVEAGAPGPAVRHDLPVHRHVRGGQLGADQHADGEPAALRHGQPGRAPAGVRQGAPGPSYAVGVDHLHHRDRGRPDRLRGACQRHRGRNRQRRAAGWHHRTAAAARVLGGQHRGADPAQGRRRPRPLPDPDLAAGRGCARPARSSPAPGPAARRTRRSTRSRSASWPSASCCG